MARASEGTSQLKRRGLVAGSAALFAAALARISERTAQAADGNPLVLGRGNSETMATTLARTNPASTDNALRVTNSNGVGVRSDSGTFGVIGNADIVGVLGISDNVGVRGEGAPFSGTGVEAVGGVFGLRAFGRTGIVVSGNFTGIQVNADRVGIQASAAVGVDANGLTGLIGRSGNDQRGIGVRGTGIDVIGPPPTTLIPAIGVLGEGDTGVQGHGSTGVLGTGDPGVVGMGVVNSGVVGTSQSGAGVLAQNASGTSATLATPSLAGEFFGDVFIHGQLTFVDPIAAAVALADGSRRQMYGLGSPEAWLEDFGTAQLSSGTVQVHLEADFAAAIRDDYHVFLTPRGDSNGLYVDSHSAGGFVVREQHGGTSNVVFSYRLVAKRRDVSATRMPTVTINQQKPAPVPKPKPVPELPAIPPRIEPAQP